MDAAVGAESQRIFDLKTKPRRSLGRLEDLATRIASIRGLAVPPRLDAAIVVAAGDHGVAAEGVSAYPQEVTAQMVANFDAGGAAINVLARQAGARLLVVDAGVATACDFPGVRSLRFGPGTANAALGPAMSRETAAAAVAAGAGLAESSPARASGSSASGRWGSATRPRRAPSALIFFAPSPTAVCGRGTGLDDEGVKRKAEVVAACSPRTTWILRIRLGALAALGGFEVAVLVGSCSAAPQRRMPVVLDGFITGAAALVAAACRLPLPGDDRLASLIRAGTPARPRGAWARSAGRSGSPPR